MYRTHRTAVLRFAQGGWHVAPLDATADRDSVTAVVAAAADYTMLLTGEPPSPTEASDFFEAVPPGRRPDDMMKLGIRRADRLLGILDLCRGYPSPGTWYIGLLLLHPDARGRGAGRAVIDGLASVAHAQGAERLMLSIIEENGAAARFWPAVGFEETRRLPSRRFGTKDHMRIEFVRAVGGPR